MNRKILKIKFSKRSKDLFYMKRDLRNERKILSEQQKIEILLDKQKEKKNNENRRKKCIIYKMN
jgi:Skp family chaperone for outer membrane proteins